MRVVCLSPLSVGLVEWRSMEAGQTLIVKATFELGGAGRVLASRFQAPLSLDQPHAEDPRALRAGSDFAPFKRDVDVLVSGRAYAQTPATMIWCGVGFDGFYKRFAALSSEPRTAIPLAPGRVRLDPYGPPVPHDVGPRAFASGPAAAISHPKGIVQAPLPKDCAPEWFNVAPQDQRMAGLAPTATLTLDGLVEGGGRRSYQMPGLEPRVLALPAVTGQEPRELSPRADTVVVDGERKLVLVTYRCELPGDLSISQLLVLLAQRGTVVDWSRASSEAAQAKTGEALDPYTLLGQPKVPFADVDDDGQETGTLMAAKAPTAALPFAPSAPGFAPSGAPAAARAGGLPFAPPARVAPPARDSQRGGLPFVPAPLAPPPATEEDDEPTPVPRPNPLRGRTIVQTGKEPTREALPFMQSLQERLGAVRPAPVAREDADHTAVLDVAALRALRPSRPEEKPWTDEATTQGDAPTGGRLGSEVAPMRLGSAALTADPLAREEVTEPLDEDRTPLPPPPAIAPPAASGAATETLEAPWLAATPTPPPPAFDASSALPFAPSGPSVPRAPPPPGFTPVPATPFDTPPAAPALLSQLAAPAPAFAPPAAPLAGWGVPSGDGGFGAQPLGYAPPAAAPAPAPAPPPLAAPPPPLGGSAPLAPAPPPAAAPARTEAEELELYVTVKASAWRPGSKLADVLRGVDLDELGWLELEGKIQSKLSDEAKEGGSKFARALRRALRDANKSIDDGAKLKG